MARRKLSATEIRKRKHAGAYHDGSRPLSAKKVARLKGEGRYHDAAVPGLYRQVTQTNTGIARSWLLRYELNGGSERNMGLGSLSIFSLAQARERAREARRTPRRWRRSAGAEAPALGRGHGRREQEAELPPSRRAVLQCSPSRMDQRESPRAIFSFAAELRFPAHRPSRRRCG